jgi:hypothetical protein
MTTLPQLSVPQPGELLAQFVIQEWNCLDCWNGIKWMTDQGTITQHILWLYQSVNALQTGDTMIILSEYFLLLEQNGLPLDETYYKGGLIQAIVDAMNRGAKVFLLFERFFLGGRDVEGKCEYCTSTGTPFDCDSESNPTGNVPLYPQYCWNGNQSLKLLIKNKNFIYYDIGYDSSDYSTIHNHFKGLSFYYKSINACSVYQGSWNLNSTTLGNQIEEAGFGFVCNLDEDFAQYYLYTDIQNLLVLENYYSRYTTKSTVVMSTFLRTNYFKNKIPTQPIIIPTLIICGPHYCDPNFGCNADGSTRKKYRSNTCTADETFVTAIDHNVSITIGIDPAPQNNAYQTNWNSKGYTKDMIYGATLLNKLILSSEKFLKTYVPAQLLDVNSCPTPDDLLNCMWNLEPTIETSIHTILKKGIPWFVIQNDGWQNASSGSLINNIMNTEGEKNNIYPKMMGFCGQRTNINDPSSGGYSMTHAKIYINEKSVLLTTAHPVVSHYNADLSNRDLLIENSPAMVAYMNNHFNYVYNKCGIFDTGSYAPIGIYKNGMPDNMSCSNEDKCCTTDKYNIYLKNDPFSSCILPVSKWKCDNNSCSIDDNGNYDTKDSCEAVCKPPPPPPPPPSPPANKIAILFVILGVIGLLFIILVFA